MTRTGLSPRLSRHLAEPYLELHPTDATRLGLNPAALAEVTSPQGRAILRVLVTDRVAPGHPFAPMHWTGETAPSGRIGALVPGLVDPVSGQPASKSAPVAIRPFPAAWHGFAVSTRPITPACDYWARAALPAGHQAELAGRDVPQDWAETARALFGIDSEPLLVRDPRKGILRMAFMQDNRLLAALFITPEPVALSRSHVISTLGAACGADILAGRPGADQPDEGALVCACFSVGANTILRGIATQRLMTVEAIGKALGAGTNCGSCRPDLKNLLRRAIAQAEH